MNRESLAYWLHAFFHEWLAEQRNCSRHTVLSYRDAWKLYLQFVARRHHRPVSALKLDELTADEVLAFLKHSESERRTSIGTRNCRLAAIRSFFRFVADREPLSAMQCAAVLSIPTKKGPKPEPDYLDGDEVAAILRRPSMLTRTSERTRHRESNGTTDNVRSTACPSRAPIACRRRSVVSGPLPRRAATTLGRSRRHTSQRTRTYAVTISTTSSAFVVHERGLISS